MLQVMDKCTVHFDFPCVERICALLPKDSFYRLWNVLIKKKNSPFHFPVHFNVHFVIKLAASKIRNTFLKFISSSLTILCYCS